MDRLDGHAEIAALVEKRVEIAKGIEGDWGAGEAENDKKKKQPPPMSRSARRQRERMIKEQDRLAEERLKARRMRREGTAIDPNYWGLYNYDKREVLYKDIQRHIRHEVIR